MNTSKKKRIMVIVSAITTLIVYIVLHELGHCIVAVSCGATITEFSILNARMNYVGGNFTDWSDLWFNANGALFPLIISYVYMLVYRDKRENMFYRIISWCVVLVPVTTLLAWVVIPFLYMAGNAPVGDDVTKFLYNFGSSHNPIIVSVTAVLLIVSAVVIMVKRHIPQNFFGEMKKK